VISGQLTKLVSKMGIPLGLIGAIGGFISDVMAPLFDFAPVVAGVSFAAFIISSVLFWRMRQTEERDLGESIMPAVLILTAGSTIIFSGWSLLFINAPDKGYLAENIEPIAQVQASLLGLEEDVEEILETTTETAEQVEEIATVQADTQETVEDTAVQVDAIATAQAQGFADIQASFASLQANQTLVDDPQTPQEWYSNARIYQIQGDNANAIAAYEGYFTFGLEFVDPYQEYVNLLNATQGIMRTRQSLNDLWAQDPDNLTLDMMTALQLDTVEEQTGRLELLAQRAPLYAPVFYELGQNYTRQLQNTFTTNLRDRQSDAFETLFTLEDELGYSRYYIDKSRAQENLMNAEQVLASYNSDNFISLDFISFYTGDGLNVIVVLPEGNVEEILFSLDDPVPSISTGKQTAGAQSFANPNIGPIPLEKGDHTLYIKYIDVNGEESDIYTFEYTIGDVVFNYQQQPYNFDLGGSTAIITMVVVDGEPDMIQKFSYSIDSDVLDQSDVGLSDALVIQTDALEQGEHVLYIQVTGNDGSQTDVIEYPFVIE